MKSFSLPVSRRDLVAPKESNDCGECTLCCDVIGVSELGKPYYARCPHLTTKCEIYHDRPQGCRDFRCAWHMGYVGDKPEWRPDKLGLLIRFNADGSATAFDIYEAIPGALETNRDRVRHIINRIRAHRSLKGLLYDRITLRFYPFGSDIPVGYPISDPYAPYTAPIDQSMHTEPLRGEATYNGPNHPLLMPRPQNASRSDRSSD